MKERTKEEVADAGDSGTDFGVGTRHVHVSVVRRPRVPGDHTPDRATLFPVLDVPYFSRTHSLFELRGTGNIALGVGDSEDGACFHLGVSTYKEILERWRALLSQD